MYAIILFELFTGTPISSIKMVSLWKQQKGIEAKQDKKGKEEKDGKGKEKEKKDKEKVKAIEADDHGKDKAKYADDEDGKGKERHTEKENDKKQKDHVEQKDSAKQSKGTETKLVESKLKKSKKKNSAEGRPQTPGRLYVFVLLFLLMVGKTHSECS